jgi:hypothetical protein
MQEFLNFFAIRSSGNLNPFDPLCSLIFSTILTAAIEMRFATIALPILAGASAVRATGIAKVVNNCDRNYWLVRAAPTIIVSNPLVHSFLAKLTKSSGQLILAALVLVYYWPRTAGTTTKPTVEKASYSKSAERAVLLVSTMRAP